MRRTLAAAVALTLLVCLLPLAGHFDACAEQSSDCLDEVCASACCQHVVTAAAGTLSALLQPGEQFRHASSAVRVCRVPDAPFRPPEVL
ncbi:MAG: hypothetical protein WCP21_23415 [Armatimonadota bacterium]